MAICVFMKEIKDLHIDVTLLWNQLAERFNTHKPLNKVHPDAAVNIHVGWPALFQQIDFQKSSSGSRKCKIFDFGCGVGQFCTKLTKMGHSVTGLDHSEAMLCIARKKVPRSVELILGNHTSALFDDDTYKEKYDIVTAIHSLEWIGDIKHAIKNLTKLLREGGLLLFAVFPKEHIRDSLIIQDLFEDFDSSNDPNFGYANFEGIRVPVYIRDAAFFDTLLTKLNMEKVIEFYPPYPKSFLKRYNWTGSICPEMLILAYRKRHSQA